jgi:aspartate racemase
MQIILPPQPFPLEICDSSQFTDVGAKVGEEARRPFNLQRPPLARVHLFPLAEQEHVLLVNMHHIISDAWSVGVFMRELSALYSARLAGRRSPLSELPIQYGDFAVWQRENMQGKSLSDLLKVWEHQFKDTPAAIDLPKDAPRPPAESYRGAAQFFTLPRGLADGLRDISRREGVTLFITLLAAFKILLQRYTRQDDVVVGSPFTGRERIETEGLIGLFVNTHPVRSDLSGDPTFGELLKRVRQAALHAHQTQDLPLKEIIKTLQPERDAGHRSPFQVVFGLQTDFTEGWSLPEITAKRLEVETGTAKFDWTLLVTDTRGELRVRFEYNTEMFEASTVQRVAKQFELLLEQVAVARGPMAEDRSQSSKVRGQDRSAATISEFSMLTPAEERQLMEWSSPGATAYERDKCVHELFEAQAEQQPDAIALKFRDQKLSYSQLNRRANRLARRLQELGVRPDVVVALSLERSLEMVVAMLAVLKAGGAYLPLDPADPQERLAFMLEDLQSPTCQTGPTGQTVLLTHKRRPANIPSGNARIICLDDDREAIAQQDSQNPKNAATPESLAYIMYTSGSSGAPKGVMVPHRGIVRLVRNTNYIKFSREDVFLQFAPSLFDASTFEIWGALLNGAQLVIFPPELPSLAQLGQTIEREKISTLWLTAGLFNQMVDEQPASLRGLRYLLTGGEALSVPHVHKALRELPGCQLTNGYGPTENTTFSCCYPVPADWAGNAAAPIGRPISNTQAFVLDSRLKPTPIGVPGELYLGGDGLARGYLNRQERTAAAFVAIPFDKSTATVLYRTGDVARWRGDGRLEFLGRFDQQVKIRGFRVEPGEVEMVLAQHAAVRNAVVLTRGTSPANRHLAAYVALQSGETLEKTGLREFLETKVPHFMVPSEWIQLKEMPLTRNGKVDRSALASIEPAVTKDGSIKSHPGPRNPTEAKLVEIWREVFGHNSIGIEDNFFRLGGHSLLAMQVVSRIDRALSIELPVGAIFEAPTIARLSKIVENLNSHHSGQPRLVPQPARASKAKEILTRLDDLSEEQVEKLLCEFETK